MVIARGSRPLIAGTVLGLAGSVAAGRWLAGEVWSAAMTTTGAGRCRTSLKTAWLPIRPQQPASTCLPITRKTGAS
jgi:hypothetical protein